MLNETENEETRLFLPHFCHWWHFDWGGQEARASLATSMVVTSMLFVILKFNILFCLFALLRSDTNGYVLYDHTKYVILLVKVQIVLNGRCIWKL